jgi:hypothetical protein
MLWIPILSNNDRPASGASGVKGGFAAAARSGPLTPPRRLGTQSKYPGNVILSFHFNFWPTVGMIATPEVGVGLAHVG